VSNARENVNLLTSADWDIATLRLANWGSGAVPPQVILKTNWVSGDGGGLFRYDASDTTTADNGGTVIVDAAGNRWKRQYSDALNVTWWQPTGASSRDITTALQAAVTLAEADGNGTIIIPEPPGSRWDLSGAITIHGSYSITLQGEGNVVIFQTAATNAFNAGVSGTVRNGWINFRNLNVFSDGTGLICLRGQFLTNLSVDHCDFYNWNTGCIYVTDCYTHTVVNTGLVDDSASPDSDYGIKIDGASGNNGRLEGGHVIGFLGASAVGLNVTGQHFGYNVVTCDFETNRRDIEVFADGTGSVEGLYLTGIYSEDTTGTGKPFLYVDNAIATTPQNIAVRNCNLLNTHIALYKCAGFTEDSNYFHGSPAGATTPGQVLYLGSGVSKWRFGNSNYGIGAFATAPDPGEWQRFPEWSTYTPTWTAASVNPVLGNGTIAARYKLVGNTVHVIMKVTMGSTTTYGTGRWAFSLPFAASASIIETVSINTITYDDGVGAVAGKIASYVASTNVNNTRPVVSSNFDDVTATAPITWAQNDSLVLDFIYERA